MAKPEIPGYLLANLEEARQLVSTLYTDGKPATRQEIVNARIAMLEEDEPFALIIQ